MTNHRARPPHKPREIIRPDTGAWLSGPSISAERVTAGQVGAGDRLLLDDGAIAEVTDLRRGDFWRHGPGVAIGWRSLHGSASGVLFRDADDMMVRVVP